MSDYIPQTDEGFRTWAENFAQSISLDPAKFMMTPAQAASIQAAVDNFVAKLAIATNEFTRTSVTIADKDDALSAAKTLCRQYAIDLKFNEGIADGDKIGVGVRPVNPDREPIDCPSTPPLINVLGNLPGTQTIRYADSSTPDSAAKPFGASELQLFLGVTEGETPATIAQSQFYGKFTRNPVQVDFDETQDGKLATYYARWASARGETGPWSVPVSFRLAA